MKTKEELILFKESGLISCEGIFSALQRKLYNFLLFYAKKTYFYKNEEYWDSAGFDGADTANNFSNYFGLRSNEFEISLKELLNFFHFEINEAYALELIKDLFQKEIAFNILGKDKLGKWKKGHRFSHAITEFTFFPENKAIKYSLPMVVFNAISQESDNIPFAKINLLLVQRLRSKFSIIFYEVFQDYAGAVRIPKIPLEKFKKLLGVKQGYTFRDFKKRCIDPAIAEINRVDDIPFTAGYEIIRNGQTPIAIQLKISKKYEPKITNNAEQNQELTENNITDRNMNAVHVPTPEPKNRIPGILPERVKELYAKFDLSRLPVEKQKEINERYKYALEDN